MNGILVMLKFVRFRIGLKIGLSIVVMLLLLEFDVVKKSNDSIMDEISSVNVLVVLVCF